MNGFRIASYYEKNPIGSNEVSVPAIDIVLDALSEIYPCSK